VYLRKDRQCPAQQLTAAHATVSWLPVAVKGCHHKLHMKNFFYSPHLYDDPTKKSIYCWGTVISKQ
jgi:hypothetical protein